MSCPDWKGLTAFRRERDGEAPAGWRDALEHAGGCPDCRRQALAADPTLIFLLRMPAVEIKPAAEVDEVAAVRQAVAAMRTASRLEALETRPRAQGWWRWAAAAGLAIVALSVAHDERFQTGAQDGAGAGVEWAEWESSAEVVVPAGLAADEPLVEELSPSGGHVYAQYETDEGFSGVWIHNTNADL